MQEGWCAVVQVHVYSRSFIAVPFLHVETHNRATDQDRTPNHILPRLTSPLPEVQFDDSGVRFLHKRRQNAGSLRANTSSDQMHVCVDLPVCETSSRAEEATKQDHHTCAAHHLRIYFFCDTGTFCILGPQIVKRREEPWSNTKSQLLNFSCYRAL